MKKFYIIGPKDGGDGIYSLVTEDGEGLASHMCSNRAYALGDLERDRPERRKEWKKKFGEYEVLYLGEDEMTKEELVKRNKEFYENNTRSK